VICDVGEDIGEPSLRIDIVELGGLDQRVDNGGALAAALLAGRAYDIGELEELAARMGEAAASSMGPGSRPSR
jgi:hypothetical protein